MDKKIIVNNRKMEWDEEMTFPDIFRFLGYKITSPVVVTRVNGQLIKKDQRDNFRFQNGAVVTVLNFLRGG